MKSIMAFTAMTALLVSAYPHDFAGEMSKREQTAPDLPSSFEGCDVRFNATVFGGPTGKYQPNYSDVARFKIGPNFHSHTAVLAQLQVKFAYSRDFMSDTAAAYQKLYTRKDTPVIAFTGLPGSGCETVKNFTRSEVVDGFLKVFRAEVGDEIVKKEPHIKIGSSPQDLDRYFHGLYDAISWNLPKQNESISLWPYLLELRYFGQCTEDWCFSTDPNDDQVKWLYTTALDFFDDQDLTIETPTQDNAKLIELLNQCEKSPVFFTDVKKREEEDPAWIVRERDGKDHYVLDLVRSGDDYQSQSYTVDEIRANVLPKYPQMVYFAPKTN